MHLYRRPSATSRSRRRRYYLVSKRSVHDGRSTLLVKYDRVLKMLGEGDFVLTVSEGTFGGKLVSS